MTSRADQTDRDESERLCAEGRALLDARQFAQAEERFLAAREAAPDHPQVHYCLGLLFSDLGRLTEALSAFDASLALDGDNTKAHNNRGSTLQQLGRLSEAEDAYRRALELGPDLPPPYLNLGNVLEQQRRASDALAVYDLAIARGLDAELFGQYRAAIVGKSTSRAPDTWVRTTFDNFAPTFDAHLSALRYAIPDVLASLVLPKAEAAMRVLDLGCGTGLVGAALDGHGHHVVGVDLSQKMLDQARARGAYDELHVSEVHEFMRTAAKSSMDAVFAADVFIYIGDLDAAFTGVARILRPGGWFAFSAEDCTGADFVLQKTGRYAQSLNYIRRLAGLDFTVVESRSVKIRMEAGTPIAGRTYLLQKR